MAKVSQRYKETGPAEAAELLSLNYLSIQEREAVCSAQSAGEIVHAPRAISRDKNKAPRHSTGGFCFACPEFIVLRIPQDDPEYVERVERIDKKHCLSTIDE